MSGRDVVEFTRSGYVKTQAVVLPLTAIFMVFGFLWKPSGVWATNFVFGYLGWWFLLVLVGELAETAVMLRKFEAKEAAYRQLTTTRGPASRPR